MRKNAKIRNRYNQEPHLIQDTVWESDKNTTKRRGEPRDQSFPNGDHKATRHRPDNMVQGFSLASALGHSPKIVPDVREFAVQFGQFVRDDFRKRTLCGNAQ